MGTRAAVSLILRGDASELELLFIHRAEHPDDPWSGHMGFPGGRQDPEDADLHATALRETREELGIALERSATLLGRLDDVQAIGRGRPLDLAITPFVFHLVEPVVMSPDPREVRDVVWIGLDALLGHELRSTLDYPHAGAMLRLPCFRWDGRVIWGLSYRMFGSLQERLEADRLEAAAAR